jgi:hypothetical protein
MNAGRTIFSQLIEHAPGKEFQKCVTRYRGDSHLRGFSCWDQYLAMAFAQLTYRESLRDIEACLRAMGAKLYHMGFRGKVTRSTLADANESHDWRIFADFAQILICMARPLTDIAAGTLKMATILEAILLLQGREVMFCPWRAVMLNSQQ